MLSTGRDADECDPAEEWTDQDWSNRTYLALFIVAKARNQSLCRGVILQKGQLPKGQ